MKRAKNARGFCIPDHLITRCFAKLFNQRIGYMGNQPNQWNGVPADVLKQYGLSYTEKELWECVSFS